MFLRIHKSFPAAPMTPGSPETMADAVRRVLHGTVDAVSPLRPKPGENRNVHRPPQPR